MTEPTFHMYATLEGGPKYPTVRQLRRFLEDLPLDAGVSIMVGGSANVGSVGTPLWWKLSARIDDDNA